MKIINAVLGDASGGRWKVFLDYADVLCDLGHEVLLLLNSKKIPDDLSLPSNVTVKIIRNSGHYDLFATIAVMRIVRDFQPQIAICHCGRSVSLMKRAVAGRVPVVAVNHSNNVKRSVRADVYFNISTHIGQLIESFPAAKGKAFHIPNMVDMPSSPSWIEPKWEKPVRIGAFGRFDVVKGFHVFIEALALLRQQGVTFKAQLGGDGVQKEELLRLISDYDLESYMTLPGWIVDQRQFFEESDIFCIPAISDAFGITPLEAAIASVPIVASDAEGHQDMFNHGEHALLVPRGDAEQLAVALEKLIDNPSKAKELSLNAFNRVTSTYCRANFSKLLENALKTIVL